MPETLTVSVVIPVFNAARFLAEALDSALDQTLAPDEVIVVDDGSTDDLPDVLARYGARIRYLRQERSGPARARNRGVAEASGSLVAFLDADDRWLPTKLEKQVALYQSDPSLGLVTTGHQMFDSEGIYAPTWNKRELLFGEGNVARAIFLRSNVATPTVMVPKEVFKAVGGFEEGIRIGEDDNLWIRIAARYRVGLVDDILVQCRMRPDSLTRDGDRFFEDVRKNVMWLYERYPEVREKIREAMPRKLSGLYAEMGCYYFRNDRMREAREALRVSLRHRPSNLRAWRCLFYSLLPLPLVRLLRRHRQRSRRAAGAEGA